MALAPTFYSKNEREEHRLQPALIPEWIKFGQYRRLCLVYALHTYMVLMSKAHPNHLWVWSDSLKWCDACHIILILKWMIEAADLDKLLKAQEVHYVAATLAFLRTHSLDEVQ